MWLSREVFVPILLLIFFSSHSLPIFWLLLVILQCNVCHKFTYVTCVPFPLSFWWEIWSQFPTKHDNSPQSISFFNPFCYGLYQQQHFWVSFWHNFCQNKSPGPQTYVWPNLTQPHLKQLMLTQYCNTVMNTHGVIMCDELIFQVPAIAPTVCHF